MLYIGLAPGLQVDRVWRLNIFFRKLVPADSSLSGGNEVVTEDRGKNRSHRTAAEFGPDSRLRAGVFVGGSAMMGMARCCLRQAC